MATIEPRKARLRNGVWCVVRAAAEADAPAMLDHQRHMVATDPNTVTEQGDKQRTLEEQRESIAAHLKNDGQLLLVAVKGTDAACEAAADGDGALLGALAFKNGDRRKVAHHGHFGISAHSDWRGVGVGSALIAALLDWAGEHPAIEKVCLGVFETNRGAQRLYTRMGFVEESRAPRYFRLGPGRYVADVWMAIYVKPGVAPEGFRTWGEGDGRA